MTGSAWIDSVIPVHTTFVLDCDGVLYLDETPIPGAARFLAMLTERGNPILFCTNNSARTPDHLVAKLRRLLGYTASAAQVITSAQAAARVLRTAGVEASAVLGMEGVEEALLAEGLDVVDGDAPAIVVGIDFSFDYHALQRAADLVRHGAIFVATNADATYPVPNGLWPGAGALVAAVAAAGGREPDIVAGKPHQAMIDLIRERAASEEIVVVGDRPETDLLLARNAGWYSVAVLTGVLRDPMGIPPGYAPDLVLNSVADLLDLPAPGSGHMP